MIKRKDLFTKEFLKLESAGKSKPTNPIKKTNPSKKTTSARTTITKTDLSKRPTVKDADSGYSASASKPTKKVLPGTGKIGLRRDESGKATPAKTTPAKTTPAKTTPAKTTPAKTAPAKTTPAKTTPAKTTPAKTTPAKTTPAKTTSSQSTPAKTTPAKTTSSQSTPSKTTETKTQPYGADPKFQEYYDAILAAQKPQLLEFTPTAADQRIDFTPATPEELAAEISAYLRPGVDQQIRDRMDSTMRQRAMTDADAASRGMLSSTWVTDYKNRIMQQESADIANAEASYRAQLLESVSARQQADADRAQQVAAFNAQLDQADADRAHQIAVFNAQMQQAAEENAYKRAGDMYQLYLAGQDPTATGGGSGGSGGSGFWADGKLWPSAQAYADYVKTKLETDNTVINGYTSAKPTSAVVPGVGSAGLRRDENGNAIAASVSGPVSGRVVPGRTQTTAASAKPNQQSSNAHYVPAYAYRNDKVSLRD